MQIRLATQSDYNAVWEIFSRVIQSEDTYVFSADTPKTDLAKYWFAPYMRTYVVEDQGQIVGTYIQKPNQIDLGSHVANCSYMVHPEAQSRGIGKRMCQHSIDEAKRFGFVAIQFNIVLSTNTAAVGLWKSFGFDIIGTTPKGFYSEKLGYIDTYIMYKSLG